MKRIIGALILATALTASGGAGAKTKACKVVGNWTDTNYGLAFTMTTNKKGSAATNPECNNAAAIIKSATLTNAVWDFNITSKKCAVVIAADFDFAAGSCTSATGTITIPGIGALPDTINLTPAAQVHPGQHSSPMMNGLR